MPTIENNMHFCKNMLACKKCKAMKKDEAKCTSGYGHRYYPNSRQRSDTCIICGFDPHFEKYERK